MIRVAAIAVLGALAATPAAAACQTIPEKTAHPRGLYPPRAYVAEIPASLVPTALAWLESEGLPHRADRIIQVAGDRGIGLVLIEGKRACDGTAAVERIGDLARALVTLVRRFQDMRGWGQERGA